MTNHRIEPTIGEKPSPVLKEDEAALWSYEDIQVIPVNAEMEHMVMELWEIIEECTGVDTRKLYK